MLEPEAVNEKIELHLAPHIEEAILIVSRNVVEELRLHDDNYGDAFCQNLFDAIWQILLDDRKTRR